MTTTGDRDPARKFADISYPQCQLHAAEAASVYRTLQRLCRRGLANVRLDTPVSELFEEPGVLDSRPPTLEPLVAAKLLELAELEQGEPLDDRGATRVLWSNALFQALLGKVCQQSSWTPASIWARSIRGIVNERVRWSSSAVACTCV